jgi:hypothetical protein
MPMDMSGHLEEEKNDISDSDIILEENWIINK